MNRKGLVSIVGQYYGLPALFSSNKAGFQWQPAFSFFHAYYLISLSFSVTKVDIQKYTHQSQLFQFETKEIPQAGNCSRINNN